jgi:hypothetical protein
MRITGQEIEAGVRDWIKDELKSGPAKEYDLGKFFFTVSSGTLGVLFVAEKLTDKPLWSATLLISFFALIFATGLSLFMVVPKKWAIDEQTDLFNKRDEVIRRTVIEAYTWFVLWFIGLAFGVWAVLT